MAIKRTADGKMDKRTKEYKEFADKMRQAQKKSAKAKKK